MTSDDILDRLGLQTKPTPVDTLLPALGIFGAGILVGAGVALMLAPKPGAELRSDIGRVANRFRRTITPNSIPLEELSRDDVYARAQELNIQGRSEMSKAELIDAVRAAS